MRRGRPARYATHHRDRSDDDFFADTRHLRLLAGRDFGTRRTERGAHRFPGQVLINESSTRQMGRRAPIGRTAMSGRGHKEGGDCELSSALPGTRTPMETTYAARSPRFLHAAVAGTVRGIVWPLRFGAAPTPQWRRRSSRAS